MVGRAHCKLKRFNLGIEAMKFIINEVPDSQLNIISITKPRKLKKLIHSLNLEKNVKFGSFTFSPEIFFKNASLHIFPTKYESFGLVLAETKIFGIPNILLGLNYVSISKGGTITEKVWEFPAKIFLNYHKYKFSKNHFSKGWGQFF